METHTDTTTAAPGVPTAVAIAGWTLQPREEKRGTYAVDIFDATTGEAGTDEFKGYLGWGDALSEARLWALANPCDGSEPATLLATPSPTEALAEDLREPSVANARPGATPPAELPADVAPASPSPTPTPTPTPTPATQQALSAFDRVDEAWSLLDARRDLRREAARIGSVIATHRAKLKTVEAELAEVEQQLDAVQEDKHRQVQMPLSPAPRTFANDAGVRASVGADAAALVRTWSFNGVEHHIEVAEQGPGRYRATLRGHPEVEGFGESADQAVEHAKNDASIRFETSDPGSTDRAHDPGPLADGASRKRKGPFEGKTVDAVIAVVRKSKRVEDAIELLECTKRQLVNFLKAGGTEIADHLAKDTTLPEPPPAKARARGKGGARR